MPLHVRTGMISKQIGQASSGDPRISEKSGRIDITHLSSRRIIPISRPNYVYSAFLRKHNSLLLPTQGRSIARRQLKWVVPPQISAVRGRRARPSAVHCPSVQPLSTHSPHDNRNQCVRGGQRRSEVGSVSS